MPDAVVVGLALNGQQFTRDITIHKRDPENTFEYYTAPIVTFFEPRSGPSIGGTKMTIAGLGFTPRLQNNSMWVRFADPVSQSQLAPPTKVLSEDLTDDSAVWYTPTLPAGTNALLQISLNNHDWHNVALGGSSHSFVYYESPHVLSVSPTFGPVKHKGTITLDVFGT